VILYIGSINRNNQTANLKWVGPKTTPVLPPPPTPHNENAFMMQATYLLSIILLGSFLML
jgi:hypothetical protein